MNPSGLSMSWETACPTTPNTAPNSAPSIDTAKASSSKVPSVTPSASPNLKSAPSNGATENLKYTALDPDVTIVKDSESNPSTIARSNSLLAFMDVLEDRRDPRDLDLDSWKDSGMDFDTCMSPPPHTPRCRDLSRIQVVTLVRRKEPPVTKLVEGTKQKKTKRAAKDVGLQQHTPTSKGKKQNAKRKQKADTKKGEITLQDEDCLLGRDTSYIRDRSGNQEFRKVVLQFSERFKDARSKEKNDIFNKVVATAEKKEVVTDAVNAVHKKGIRVVTRVEEGEGVVKHYLAMDWVVREKVRSLLYDAKV